MGEARVEGWGVIWLGEVTMRYGREEGRLFDTATHWGCAVIYNGNTSELAESRMACMNHTHTHARMCACTQAQKIAHRLNLWAFLLPDELPSPSPCVFLGLRHLFDHVEDGSLQRCIESKQLKTFLLSFRI